MTPTIRLATEYDAAALQAIYAPYVRQTVISFELEPPDVNEMRGRIHKTLTLFPWLVCEDDGRILGYAYASKHRERSAYQWSVDVSVYVTQGVHRRGIGSTLYKALFMLLRQQGFYNAFAGIAIPNEASIGLHRALGFQLIGVYPHVGYKLGAWHNVAWLGLELQKPADEPRPPLPIHSIIDKPEAQLALKSDLLLLKR